MSTESRASWFGDLRFGVFVHWGLYAIPAKGEWLMMLERWSPEEYTDAFVPQFNPRKDCIKEWVAAAKDAGAEYMVFTTRHHDGFCLFDSKASIGDFTSMNSPAQHDFVADFAREVRAAGMKVGFYYSLADWRIKPYRNGVRDLEADRMLADQAHAQIRELMTNYGKVDILWYDGAFGYDEKSICWGEQYFPSWRPQELNAMVRELQPDIAINDRSGVPEDFSTPEQHITAAEPGRMWESCMTMNESWGYHRWDNIWKSTSQLIINLVTCASGKGSYLLNIGPMADGSVPGPSKERLAQIGDWMRAYGETIHDAEPVSLFIPGFPFFAFKKDGILYVHVNRWGGSEMRFYGCPGQVDGGYMVKSGAPVTTRQVDDLVYLSGMPDAPEDEFDTLVALRFAK